PPPGALDHDDHGPHILAAGFGTWAIACVSVGLRLWTRSVIVKKVGPSDWCIVLSLIAAAFMCAAYYIQVQHGLGKHVWDIDFAVSGVPMQKASWFSLLAYCFTLTFTKISICILYLTIFTFEWVRKACWGILIMNIIISTWAVISTVTACIPLEAFWDLSVKPVYCGGDKIWWINTGLGIFTSILMFLIPIPAILPLKLPRRQKVIIVSIFALGFFEVLVSFIRLCMLIKLKQGDAMQDFTYDGAELNYWLFIEVHTGIVIACLMTLKPLIGRLCPNLLSGASNPSTDSTGIAPENPPLTIGSRPLRNGQIQRDSWMQYGVRRHQAQQPSQGDIVLEDVHGDNKAHGGGAGG
ncbi:hypothetical protein V8F20_011410, partial [Naviculisporaceae sp. PSN 640]